MAKIKINLNKRVGKIKPMHGGGQPPIIGGYTGYFHYITEMGAPYSRLHDVGGAFGDNSFVDIPRIFKNFDADETDPANYDFTFTDVLIKALVDAKVEPYFRLGISIENYANIKTYHTYPPKDYEKWARICEHIVAHYTEGWANGFNYKITYWEIWNEPDNNFKKYSEELGCFVSEMWNGTPEEFYRLYDVTAKHLKARFPNIKVGGYGSCGFYYINASPETLKKREKSYKFHVDFFIGFLEYIKAHNSPFDFFSWHSYSTTKRTLERVDWMYGMLEKYGYGNVETHLNEWNTVCKEKGTAHHGAEVAAMMLGMQNTRTDICCIYDMKMGCGDYMPLFDANTRKPVHAYYSMVAFNQLYKLGAQVSLECDMQELYAVAATNGKKNAIVISNITGEEQELNIEGVDLTDARFSVIDETRLLSWSPAVKTIKNNEVYLIEF